MFRKRVLPMAAGVMLVLGLGTSAAGASSAAAPAGSTGHDVSYPQCSGANSSSTTATSLGGAFGIVGVTDGLPWSTNPCLGAESQWASGLAYVPALYANTANPAPHSSFFWPSSGSSAPALCKDSTSTTDPGCAYDYGWHAAQNALSTAGASVSGATTLPWWLDVEVANSWNGNGSSNAADLQGFVDYLRGQGVPSVGIYTSTNDWNTITGGYTVSTAASYQSAWSSEFTPAYPLSGSPTWVAGAGSSANASSTCSAAAFTGTKPQLAQFQDGTGYDADLVCGTPAQQSSFSMSISPGSGSTSPGGSTAATVTVSESGPAQTVALSATGQPSGVNVAFSPNSVSASGSSTMTVTVGSAVPPGMYQLSITGTGSSGATTSSYALTVSAAPQSSFSLSMSPGSATVPPGGSTAATVTVSESGPAQAVSLTSSGQPPGVTVAFSPASVSASGSSQMTVTVGSAVPPGRYPLSITGTGSSGSTTATYSLTVGVPSHRHHSLQS